MAKTKDTADKTADYIPLKEKIIYGAGDLFGGGSATIISVLLLNFFDVGLGIPSAIAGVIILVSKFWDAVSDPLMGVISDNTRGKFGRRKPYIVLGGALTIFAFAWLFAPIAGVQPDALKITVAVFAYVFYCTVSTISQVPLTSLASDISPDYKQRNGANTVKLVFDMAAAGLCFLVPTLLYEATFEDGAISPTVFWLVMTLGFGGIFAVTLITCGLKVKERTPYNDERAKFSVKSFVKPFAVKSYRYHIFMYIAAFLCMDIMSAMALYYMQTIMVGTEIFGMNASTLFLIAPMMLCAAAWIPVCYKIMRKKTKQFAYRVGLPIYVLGTILLALYQPSWGNTWLVPVFAVMIGLGLGGAQMMPWLVFPDAVDVGELKFGERDTGSFSGLMTFSRKASTAVAIAVVGAVVEVSGFDGELVATGAKQAESAGLAVRITMAVSVTLLMALGFWASLRYKVTDKKLERIRYFLDKNHNHEELTEEEQAEKDALKKELC